MKLNKWIDDLEARLAKKMAPRPATVDPDEMFLLFHKINLAAFFRNGYFHLNSQTGEINCGRWLEPGPEFDWEHSELNQWQLAVVPELNEYRDLVIGYLAGEGVIPWNPAGK